MVGAGGGLALAQRKMLGAQSWSVGLGPQNGRETLQRMSTLGILHTDLMVAACLPKYK